MSEHELWNELGNLYFLSGAYDRAARSFQRAIEMNPRDGEPYANLALTYAQTGRLAEASDLYRRGILLLGDELDKAVCLHKLGDVYLRLKQFPQAAETYQQTEALVADLGPIVESSKPQDLLLHCQPSKDAAPQPAVPADETPALPPSDPGLPPLLEELTPWWFDGQSPPNEDPQPDLDSWFLDGSVSRRLGETVVFTERLAWEPETTSHTLDVVETVAVETTDGAEEAGGMVDAPADGQDVSAQPEKILEDVSSQPVEETGPVMPEPDLATAVLHADQPQVITDAPEFSAESMTDPLAVQYQAPVQWPVVELSQEERLEIQATINKFKRVLEINPRNAFAWDTLGGQYKALGQYEEAIDAFQKAVSLDSSKAFYYHHLGLVYAAVGRHEDAMHVFERVIEVDPNHSLAHATLGGYYRKNGNEELAREHIEKARISLANDENDYNRACMEAICGNTDRSLELLELALKNRQTYVNWALKDPDLDFIRSDPRFHTMLSEYAVKPA